MPEKLYGILTKNQLEILIGSKPVEGFLFHALDLVWVIGPQPSIKEVVGRLKNVWYPYTIDPVMLEVLDFRSDMVQFYKINKIIDPKKYMILI